MELYRYFKIKRGLQTLRNGKMHMSTLDRFNDLFELLSQTNYVDKIVSNFKKENLKDIVDTKIGQELAKEFEQQGLINDADALITTGAIALISPLIAFSFFGLYSLLSEKCITNS